MLVVLLAAFGTIMALGGPADTSDIGRSAADVRPDATNSAIYQAMVNASLPDAVVDTRDDLVLIRYNVPANRSVVGTEYYAMGVAASAAPGVETIRLEVFDRFVPHEVVTVSADDVRAFNDGEISRETFRERIERRPMDIGGNASATA